MALSRAWRAFSSAYVDYMAHGASASGEADKPGRKDKRKEEPRRFTHFGALGLWLFGVSESFLGCLEVGGLVLGLHHSQPRKEQGKEKEGRPGFGSTRFLRRGRTGRMERDYLSVGSFLESGKVGRHVRWVVRE
jgi:hypothetical protein